MTLNQQQLAEVLGVLDKIDRGLKVPRIGDRIGQFLRQYESGRRDLRGVLALHSVASRSDGAVSGRLLGPVDAHALLTPEVSVLEFPLGEAASTLVVSEQLGGIANLRMWLKAGTAQAAFGLLQSEHSVRMLDDYRWTPLAQITPGEARIESVAKPLAWQHARCLKAVADDLLRPPHAVEYVLDYRMGPPGLKFFRTLCAIKTHEGWNALPCFGSPRPIAVRTIGLEKGQPALGELSSLLAYREPWSSDWIVVERLKIQPEEAVAHSIAWAHFRSELTGEPFDSSTAGAARQCLRAAGVRSDQLGTPNLDLQLLPATKTLLQHVRGIG